jgi:hypothetical protein
MSLRPASLFLTCFALACGPTTLPPVATPEPTPEPRIPDPPPSAPACEEVLTEEPPRCAEADPTLPREHGPLSLSFTALQFNWQTKHHRVGRIVRITNQGTGDAVIESATVTGAGFSLTPVALPAVLAAGQELALEVSFLPELRCCHLGALSVVTDQGVEPISIPLSGVGMNESGAIGIDPHSIYLGDIPVGTSKVQEVWLWNAGTAEGSTLANVGVSREEMKLEELSPLPAAQPVGSHYRFVLRVAPVELGMREEGLYLEIIGEHEGVIYTGLLGIPVRYSAVDRVEPATR